MLAASLWRHVKRFLGSHSRSRGLAHSGKQTTTELESEAQRSAEAFELAHSRWIVRCDPSDEARLGGLASGRRGRFTAAVLVNRVRLAAASFLLIVGCGKPAARVAPTSPSLTPTAAPEAPLVTKRMFSYPDNRPGTTADTLFGTLVKDPYRWLEDEHAPTVSAWMNEQDAWA